MYYNTTKINGEELTHARHRAASQTLQILKFFIGHPGGMYTPIEIHKAMEEAFLLTSVRRSISVLTKEGYLTKTENKALESNGAINYKWTLNIGLYKSEQLKLF